MNISPILEGAPNFREVSGYLAANGKTIRPGRIFRSQGLYALTDSDLEILRSLEIRLICDLRSKQERSLHPTRWLENAMTRRLEIDIQADVRANNRHLLDFLRKTPNVQGAQAMMIASYKSFPAVFAGPLKRLFSHIQPQDSEPGLPVLVHCSAGKDRTGFAIAMILSALGVSREAILQDYMLTADRINARLIAMTGDALTALLGYVPNNEVLEVIASVTPKFLGTAFESIEKQYGSVDEYLASACGLDAASRKQMAVLLTE